MLEAGNRARSGISLLSCGSPLYTFLIIDKSTEELRSHRLRYLSKLVKEERNVDQILEIHLGAV